MPDRHHLFIQTQQYGIVSEWGWRKGMAKLRLLLFFVVNWKNMFQMCAHKIFIPFRTGIVSHKQCGFIHKFHRSILKSEWDFNWMSPNLHSSPLFLSADNMLSDCVLWFRLLCYFFYHVAHSFISKSLALCCVCHKSFWCHSKSLFISSLAQTQQFAQNSLRFF